MPRRLSEATPEDIAEMEALNPKSPAQFREEEEIRRFLAGEDTKATGAALATPHKHER